MSKNDASDDSSDGEVRCTCGRTFGSEWKMSIHAGHVHNGDADGEKYPWRDAEWLRRKYWDEGLTQEKIAEEADTHPNQIRRWMDKLDVETRPTHWNSRKYPELGDEEYLRRVWVEERLSKEEIAEDVGCAPRTVPNVMREYGIERDEPASVFPELASDVALHCLYVERKLTAKDIATLAGTDKQTVLYHLERAEIPRREGGFRKGEEHHGWKGGKFSSGGVYGYSWDAHRKEALRRDNYTCQRCGIERQEHIERYGTNPDGESHHVLFGVSQGHGRDTNR